MSNNNNNKNHVQRALVLQGGGALGAYEAGVIYELYKILTKEDEIEGKTERPLFDVIIGTSIGAINAAVLVSQFLNKREHELNISSAWQKAVEKLVEFWKYLSSPSIDIEVQGTNSNYKDYKVMIDAWKRESEKGTPGVASKQAFEHYLFGKIALDKGVEKVYDKPEQIKDNRFFDKKDVWNMYNNDKLRDSIQNSENGDTFPIKTSFNENDPQPRLLVVSVDIENGSTVTFDSYEKPDEIRKTMFVYNEKEKEFDYTLQYPNGVDIEHIMASSVVPLFYNFRNIEEHKFWDGYILSNTPLKELMEEHKAYWEYKIGDDDLLKSIWIEDDSKRVPDLEVYIVNVYPRKQKNIPQDYDSLKNRLQNIQSSDKTTYEEWVATLMMDYIDIIEKIIKKGNGKGWIKDIKDILEHDTKSTLFTYLPKKEKEKYKDLLKRRFRITVKRIERKDDENSVSSQITDFTVSRINELIDEGKKDAKQALERCNH